MLLGFKPLYESLPWKNLGLEAPSAAISQIQNSLPNAICEGCIEWQLSNSYNQIDLWAVIPSYKESRSKVSTFLDSKPVASSPAWNELYSFFNEWVCSTSPIVEFVGDIFLEFDLDGCKLPNPILVASMITSSGVGSRQAVDAYYETLSRGPLNEPLNAQLGRLLDSLPSTVNLRNVTLIKRNGQQRLRIIVYVNVLELEKVIRLIKLPLIPPDIDSSIRSIRKYATYVGLQIDVGNYEFTCLEIFFTQKSALKKALPLLLQHLAELKICDPKKIPILEYWVSNDSKDSARNLIIKLRWNSIRCYEAKAYLMYLPYNL